MAQSFDKLKEKFDRERGTGFNDGSSVFSAPTGVNADRARLHPELHPSVSKNEGETKQAVRSSVTKQVPEPEPAVEVEKELKKTVSFRVTVKTVQLLKDLRYKTDKQYGELVDSAIELLASTIK